MHCTRPIMTLQHEILFTLDSMEEGILSNNMGLNDALCSSPHYHREQNPCLGRRQEHMYRTFRLEREFGILAAVVESIRI